MRKLSNSLSAYQICDRVGIVWRSNFSLKMAASSSSVVLRRGISASSWLRREIETASATAGGHGGGWKLWKNMTLFVGLPAVGVCMVNAYLAHLDHAHHERPEFVKYDHMRLRGKKYPWGDGNHSFFHTSANPLPDGYED